MKNNFLFNDQKSCLLIKHFCYDKIRSNFLFKPNAPHLNSLTVVDLLKWEGILGRESNNISLLFFLNMTFLIRENITKIKRLSLFKVLKSYKNKIVFVGGWAKDKHLNTSSLENFLNL